MARLVCLRPVDCNGRKYVPGDEFPGGELTEAQVSQLTASGAVGEAEDAPQELPTVVVEPVVAPAVVEPVSEVAALNEEPAIDGEESKPKRKGRRR